MQNPIGYSDAKNSLVFHEKTSSPTFKKFFFDSEGRRNSLRAKK
jgi:hypothetical protein